MLSQLKKKKKMVAVNNMLQPVCIWPRFGTRSSSQRNPHVGKSPGYTRYSPNTWLSCADKRPFRCTRSCLLPSSSTCCSHQKTGTTHQPGRSSLSVDDDIRRHLQDIYVNAFYYISRWAMTRFNKHSNSRATNLRFFLQTQKLRYPFLRIRTYWRLFLFGPCRT